MKVWLAVALTIVFTSAAQAQYESPAVDFFMHDRLQDTLLRQRFRLEGANPLRVEYWYVNWLNSDTRADEYTDHLHVESTLPLHRGEKLMVDLPFQYSYIPVWAENGNGKIGNTVSILELDLRGRWVIADRLRSIIGVEFDIKGEGESFGESIGRRIGFLNALFSYDLHPQLSFAAGALLDRYYYDTDEELKPSFELDDRLFLHPAAMLNWHPNDNFTIMLGAPVIGVHLSLGQILKAEARVRMDKETEAALSLKPVERVNLTLRLLNTPYTEIPVEIQGPSEDELVSRRLSYVDRSIIVEAGWELNPAALVSLGFRYGIDGDVGIEDISHGNAIQELEGKPYFSIGTTFTVDIEALLGMQ